jgi:Terminase large subunit, T4likevirus-type, N-terminal
MSPLNPDRMEGLFARFSRKQVLSVARSTARINIWAGAVRSGKTVASLLAWLMFVAGAPRGELAVVAKTNTTAMRNVFAPLQDFGVFGELAAQTHYTPGAPFGTILGRRVWVIGASDVRAETRLRGLTAAGAYVDEASLVSEEFFSQLLARMSVPGARLFATTNPDNPAHWLRRNYILRERDLNLRHWHFVLDDNPSLTPEYIADLKAENVGLFYKRRVLGLWVAAEGAVYDMWDPDVHVVDIIPPITGWLGLGLDYGTTAPTAALLLGLSNRGGGEDGTLPCLFFVDEFRWDSRQRHRQLTDVEISGKLRDFQAGVRFPGTRLHGPQAQYVIVDPSAASLKVQLAQDGWSVADADNAVLDGIRLVSSLLAKRQLKVARTCTGWIDEIGGYSWDDKAALAGEDKPVKADDHSLDAGRYGVKTTQGIWHSHIPLAA